MEIRFNAHYNFRIGMTPEYTFDRTGESRERFLFADIVRKAMKMEVVHADSN